MVSTTEGNETASACSSTVSKNRSSKSSSSSRSKNNNNSSDHHAEHDDSQQRHSSKSSSGHRHSSKSHSKSSSPDRKEEEELLSKSVHHSLKSGKEHTSKSETCSKDPSSTKEKVEGSHNSQTKESSSSKKSTSSKSREDASVTSGTSKTSKTSRSSKSSNKSKSSSSSKKEKAKTIYESSQPSSLEDVLVREAASRRLCRTKDSCVRRGKDHDRKHVRFATNERTEKVWSLVKVFEKEAKEHLVTLFWTRDELYQTYADDKDIAAVVEPQYFEALRTAYKSSLQKNSNVSSIEMDEGAWAACSNARGLEIDCFPYLRDFAGRHSQEVLACQQAIWDLGRTGFDHEDQEKIRHISIEYSKGNRLVAARMAQFDNKDSFYSFKSTPTK